MKTTNNNEAGEYKKRAGRGGKTAEPGAALRGRNPRQDSARPQNAAPGVGGQKGGETLCGTVEYRGNVAVGFSGVGEAHVREGTGAIAPHAFEGCTFLQRVHLPESIREIGRDAFRGCVQLTELVFPGALTDIGAGAFCDCKSLSRVALPAGLRSIGDAAFAGCTGLRSVSLPAGLRQIGERAFDICAELAEISVAPGNRFFEVRGGCLIRLADRTLIRGTNGAAIPGGGRVLTIGEAAFSGCRRLVMLTVPAGVKTIADNAFMHCTALREAEIGAGVAFIGEGAFYNCPTLRRVYLAPDSGLCAIGAEAFRFCDRLEEVAVRTCKKEEKPL